MGSHLSGVGAQIARCIIPQTVRRKLRDWQAETASFRLFAARGCDSAMMRAWTEKLENNKVNRHCQCRCLCSTGVSALLVADVDKHGIAGPIGAGELA